MLIPSLYFHIPFCKGKCSYCSFYSVEPQSTELIDALLAAELAELRQNISNYGPGGIETIYIGGGSPSVIPKQLPGFIAGIFTALDKRQISWAKAEITVEVNPGDLSREFLEQLTELGVNRISIGTQSFANTELKMLGRRHIAADIYTAVDNCRSVGLENISLDLIFALPGQNLGQWQDNLRKAIELVPKHISVYSLTWEAGTRFDRQRASGQLQEASDTLDREMYYLAIDTLAEAGIMQYEISNFARSGYESRHNLRYWDDEDYLGIGPAAGSHIAESRWSNIADISEYISAIKSHKSPAGELFSSTAEENMRQGAILALRKKRGISIEHFSRKFGISPLEFFAGEISENISNGLLVVSNGNIQLSRKGLSFADAVSEDLI